MFKATNLFNESGVLVTSDHHELAGMIVKAEVGTIASDHESKLVRLEIGHAIRCIAAIRNSSLTDAIVDMGLCKSTNRAEKTFLKYARIAGSGVLLSMATNPQVSLSVLDEIAASKKPESKDGQARFLSRVVNDINDICKSNLIEEDLDPDAPEAKLVGLGVTRNQAVGVIRRVQIEMGVATKAGNGNGPERPGAKEVQAKILHLLNLMRVAWLPLARRDDWLAKHDLTMADVGGKMLSLQADLVGACILTEEADDLKPESIPGLKRILDEAPEVEATPELQEVI
jgi:hypothetical protein